MVTYITGDIVETLIQKGGILLHQVNCQNRIGAGVSGAIIRRFPRIEQKYHDYCKQFSADKLYGLLQYVELDSFTYVANSFTQYYYGNAKKTGKNYTDEDQLIHNIGNAAIFAHDIDKPLLLPWRVGCGLAGGDFDYVLHNVEQRATDSGLDNIIWVKPKINK